MKLFLFILRWDLTLMLATIICLLFTKQKRTREQLAVIVMYSTYFIIDVIASIVIYYSRENQWVYNLSVPVEIAAMIFGFRILLKEQKAQSWLTTAFLLNLVFWFINYQFIQGSWYYNSYTYMILSFLTALGCFLYLYHFVNTKSESPLYDWPFWFCSTLLVWSLVQIPYYWVLNTLVWIEKTQVTETLDFINEKITTLTFAINFIVAFWTQRIRT